MAGAAAGDAQEQRCDFPSSRLARDAIVRDILPYLGEGDGDCVFDPSKDILRDIDASKELGAHHTFTCKVCGKIFRSEAYADRHIVSRHPELINSNGACFADYSDVLGCGTVAAQACSEAALTQRKLLCKSLLKRCFPSKHGVYERLERKMCASLACRDGFFERRGWEATSSVLHGGGGSETSHALLRIFLFVVACCIAAFAALRHCERSLASTKPDLRRKAPRGGGGILRRIWNAWRKKKAT